MPDVDISMIAFAMSNPKDDERVIARDMLEIDPALLAHRPGQTVIADKGYRSAEFEACSPPTAPP